MVHYAHQALELVDMVAQGDRWTAIRERTLEREESRSQYARTYASVTAMRRLLQEMDAVRESAGISKSELARLVGASPASIRRLFTSPDANPTMRTILDLASALDMEVSVRQSPRRTASTSSANR